MATYHCPAAGQESGLEVPMAAGASKVPTTTPFGLVTPPGIPRLRLKEPEEPEEPEEHRWDDVFTGLYPEYPKSTDEERWGQKAKAAAAKVYRDLFGKNDEGPTDPVVLEGLRAVMEPVSKTKDDPHKLTWAPKKPKKGVSWGPDVPYKHNAAGEVFKGPVSSQLTFDKELPVF